MTVVDAGANEGLYTLFAARRVGPSGRVLAVEPSLRELGRLRANVRLNRLDNVRVVPQALADREDKARLLLAEAAHAGQNTLGAFIYAGVAAADEVMVDRVRLDDLLAAQGHDRIDVIKLDIEGAEFAALRGAEETVARCRPALLFELSDDALQRQGASAAALLDFLRSYDYRLYTFDPATGLPLAAEPDSDLGLNVIALSAATASRLGLADAVPQPGAK
jgi:FkbM family methyltransferase